MALLEVASQESNPPIVAKPVIMVAGDIPRMTAENLARRMRERIPNTEASPADLRGAFYLIGSSGGAPYKGLWENDHRFEKASRTQETTTSSPSPPWNQAILSIDLHMNKNFLGFLVLRKMLLYFPDNIAFVSLSGLSMLDSPPHPISIFSLFFQFLVMRPTYRPHRLKRIRKIGFRARMETRGGRAIINARRRKGRKRLVNV